MGSRLRSCMDVLTHNYWMRLEFLMRVEDASVNSSE